MHALILTSPATSIKQQARYIGEVLVDTGWNVYVVDYSNAYLAYRYVSLYDPIYLVSECPKCPGE